MGFDLRVIKIEEFFHTDARDTPIDLEAAYGLLRRVVRETTERGIYRVMIDARGNPTGLSVADMFELVGDFQRYGLTPDHRVALLRARPEALERARYLETLASTRGFKVRAFAEFEEALDFLNES
jgi:hypothetical protein